MYVFVTSKCNMACLHCCHSCRPGRGSHMKMETFKKVCLFAERHYKDIVIGGGEPTLHPDLIEMINFAYEHRSWNCPIFMVTNGTCSTELWKKLIELDEGRILDVHVSDSPFHNRALQNPFVMRSASRRGMRWWADYKPFAEVDLAGRAVRNKRKIEEYLKKQGNKWQVCFTEDNCCNEYQIMPNGHIIAHHPYKDFGPLSWSSYCRAGRH